MVQQLEPNITSADSPAKRLAAKHNWKTSLMVPTALMALFVVLAVSIQSVGWLVALLFLWPIITAMLYLDMKYVEMHTTWSPSLLYLLGCFTGLVLIIPIIYLYRRRTLTDSLSI